MKQKFKQAVGSTKLRSLIILSILLFSVTVGWAIVYLADDWDTISSPSELVHRYLQMRGRSYQMCVPDWYMEADQIENIEQEYGLSFFQNQPGWFVRFNSGQFKLNPNSPWAQQVKHGTRFIIYEDIIKGELVVLRDTGKNHEEEIVYQAPAWPQEKPNESFSDYLFHELSKRRVVWTVTLVDPTESAEKTPSYARTREAVMSGGSCTQIVFTGIEKIDTNDFVDVGFCIPDGITNLDIFVTSDLMPSGYPWIQAATNLPVVSNGVVWSWNELSISNLSFAGGDGTADDDNDGLIDAREFYLFNTDMNSPDSDGDGFIDSHELSNGTDPLDNASFPQLFIRLNDGALFTSDTNITVSFPGYLADNAEIGEASDLSDGVTSMYSTAMAYSLQHATNGSRQVYGRLSRNSETSAIISASIILDTEAPVFSSISPTNESVTNRRWIKITGVAADAFSQVRIFVDDQWVHGNTSTSFWHGRIPLQQGTNEFVIRAEDLAGNTTNRTIRVIQDTTGDTNAPSLDLSLPGQSVDTNGQCSVLYGDSPGLYFSGVTDDETAKVLVYTVADSTTNGPWEAVVTFPQVWAQVQLQPGTNLVLALASDAAGNTSTASCHAVRDTNVVFHITYPKPYQVMNAASTVVSGVASPMFLNGTITVNNVATTIEDHDTYITFTTTSGVPLSAGRTEIIGRAAGNGLVYYADPTVIGYELKQYYRIGDDRLVWMSICGCSTYDWIFDNSYLYSWTGADRVLHYESSYDEYKDCIYDTCIPETTCNSAPSPIVTDTYNADPPYWAIYGGFRDWVSDSDCSFDYATDDWSSKTELTYVKRWPTQELQMVVLELPNMQIYDSQFYTPVPVEDPSTITYKGQTGFWHNGNVSFIVPIMTEVEYTITQSDFEWPSFEWSLHNYGGWGTGFASGKYMIFHTAISNSILNVELVRPVVDALYPANNNYTFDDSTPGECRVACIVKVTPDTPEIRSQLQGKLKWSIESVPGSTLTWENGGSSEGVGVYDSAFGDWRETAIFTDLPTDNTSFGDKVATLEYEGNTYEGLAQIFYSKDAKNHPGTGSGTTPNWYYYWSQTTANSGSHIYGGNVLGKAGSVPYTGPNAGNIFIYDGASSTGAGYFPQFQLRTYIDCFASVVRHEIKHQDDYYANWNPYSFALDADATGGSDLLKDSVESSLTGMNGYSFNNTKSDTNGDGVKDGEDYASTAENSWTVGSADDEDWASPGNNSTK